MGYDKTNVDSTDQCKMFFSYEKNLTDWSKDNKNLNTLISKRWNIYEWLKWYDKTTEFPLKDKKYREKIVDALKWTTDLRSNPLGNLIWMTAFYKKNLDNKHEWRGYSMTTLWNTTPLWWYMESIAASELESTKEWFRNNLDKTELHKNVIKTSIENQINIALWRQNISLNDNQLERLLKWEESIDIWNENDKIRVTLNAEYKFYLLQECANESIGIQLNWLEIVAGDTQIETVTSQDDPNKIEVKTKTHKRINWSWIYTNSHEWMNQQDLSRKWHFSILGGGGKVVAKKEQDNTITNQEWWTWTWWNISWNGWETNQEWVSWTWTWSGSWNNNGSGWGWRD